MTESNLLTSPTAEATRATAATDTNAAKAGSPISSPSSTPQVYDLYADLFSKQSSASGNLFSKQSAAAPDGSSTNPPQVRSAPVQAAPATAPRSPTTLVEAGLHLGQLSDLVLKQLYLQGTVLGGDISRSTRLP